MPHDSGRAHRTENALVSTERSAVPRVSPASSQVERHIHTDERTHARSVYERDGQGREMYATYYNSNDDPSFQARYNKDGQRAFVTTSTFSFVSNGGGLRKPMRAPTAIVEEEAGAGPEADTRRPLRTRETPTAQPIVEEPDEDDAAEYAYMDEAHRPRDARYDAPDRPSPYHHHHLQHRQQQPPRHYGDEPDMYQVSPFVRPNTLMRDFFMDGFFDGPRNPFGMMDAMQHRMSQQRAAMFGGVDPFASFF